MGYVKRKKVNTESKITRIWASKKITTEKGSKNINNLCQLRRSHFIYEQDTGSPYASLFVINKIQSAPFRSKGVRINKESGYGTWKRWRWASPCVTLIRLPHFSLISNWGDWQRQQRSWDKREGLKQKILVDSYPGASRNMVARNADITTSSRSLQVHLQQPLRLLPINRSFLGTQWLHQE